MDAADEEVIERHPLDPPDYALEDLQITKANSILYQEFENRTEKVLLQPDVEDHLRRSKQRIKWAKIGGGGTCSLRLIDDLSRRIQFLEQCIKARKALTEGKYAAEVLKVKHDDLVWLEKNIGGFWARPRRVGKEWRYLPQNAINELATEPETLDGLEEFTIVNDLLHTIISSTGLCNLLLFGSRFPKKRNGYFEDRLMGEYTWFNQNLMHEDDILYGADGESILLDRDIAPSWIYEPETIKARSTIVNEFVAASLPNLVKEGKVDVERNSWSDDVFEVDLDGEPGPLSFGEKDYLAQRALALKNHLRYLLSNNAVLHHEDTKIHEYATVVGPSGVNIGFRGNGRTDGGFVFPASQTDGKGFPLWTGEKFRDMWNGWRYPKEVNHRGREFDVLREEFRHAIQCWWYLWQKFGKDIRQYLLDPAEVRGDREVAGDRGEEMVVEEPDFDENITTPETTLEDDDDFERLVENSSDNHRSTSGKNDMHFQITPLTTAEVIHDTGEVESFSIEEDPFMEIFISSPLSREPTVKPSPQKHWIEEPTSPNPKRQKISYLHKYDIHPSHLDGASRVCPETGETWWADAPPYFMFGETPTMAKVISDQMKEDLLKGMLFIYSLYAIMVSANFE